MVVSLGPPDHNRRYLKQLQLVVGDHGMGAVPQGQPRHTTIDTGDQLEGARVSPTSFDEGPGGSMRSISWRWLSKRSMSSVARLAMLPASRLSNDAMKRWRSSTVKALNSGRGQLPKCRESEVDFTPQLRHLQVPALALHRRPERQPTNPNTSATEQCLI